MMRARQGIHPGGPCFQQIDRDELHAASMTDAGRTGDAAIQTLNEQYQTYVFVEQNLMRRKASLMAKLPDIHKTLDAVLLLQKRREADESVRDHLLCSMERHDIHDGNEPCWTQWCFCKVTAAHARASAGGYHSKIWVLLQESCEYIAMLS